MTDFNFYIKNLAFFKVHPLGFFYFENVLDFTLITISYFRSFLVDDGLMNGLFVE